MSVFFSDTHTCHHLIEHAWSLRLRRMTLYLNTCLAGRRQRLRRADFEKRRSLRLGFHVERERVQTALRCRAYILVEMKRILATEGSVHRTSRAECRSRKTSTSSSYSAVHLHPCILNFPAYTAIRVHLTVYTTISFHWQVQEEHYPGNQRR